MKTTEQMSLWEAADFDGTTYDRERDHDRLGAQMQRVLTLMSDGEWRTLGEIAWTGSDEGEQLMPEASVSARLRDLRKPKFGGHTVERRYAGDGLWEYRLEVRR